MDKNMRKSFSDKTFSHKENKSKDENKNNIALKMRRSISDKSMLYNQKKKNDDNKNRKSNRFLITMNVLGSAGPLRFVVNGEDSAAGVIEAALKLYAREERLPILGSDINCFFLYPANAGYDGINIILGRNCCCCCLLFFFFFFFLGNFVVHVITIIKIFVAALKPSEAIGSRGLRNFVLCKKQSRPQMTEARSQVIDRKGSGWRAWLQKSLSLKILPH
ncbi:hypothetical protein Pfo_008508 [Paulownia fortunei]|nr:hypothetical protein Pfo_008508 [Paulownia fortunei]